MRLQSLPKVLCPVALACVCATAQETPAAPEELSVSTAQLEPAKPLQEIPGDPIPQPDPAPAPAEQPANPEPATPATPLTVPEIENHEEVQPPALPADAIGGDEVAPVGPVPLSDGGGQAGELGPLPSIDGEIGSLPPADADAMTDLASTETASSSREWLKGLGFGGTVTAMYDTNVYQTSGRRGVPKDDDIAFMIRPYVAYISEKYGLTYAAKLIVDADEYLDHSDISGVGYDASFSLGYSGKKMDSDLSIDQSLVQGIDRYYGAYVQREDLKIDAKSVYKFSRKTEIEGRLGYSSDSPDDRRFFDTSREYANLAVSWRSSPLLKLGAGLGWSQAEGDRQITRDTIGPLLRADYKLSKKLNFEGETGFDFVSYDGGDNDTFLSARIAASYVPSPFWAFDLSILRDTQPDGSVAGAYREIFAVRGGVKKKISKTTLSLGIGYEQTQYTRPGSGGSIAGLDRDYITVDFSVAHPIYRDMVDLEIFTKYRDESFDDTSRSWSGSQFGVSLRSAF